MSEDYYVECKNEECGWSGLLSECHEPGLCPICGEEVEPCNEIAG